MHIPKILRTFAGGSAQTEDWGVLILIFKRNKIIMEIVKQYEGGKLYLVNGIRIVDIRGDWFTMGRQYGCLAKENLQHVLDFLKAKTIEETKSQRG